MLNRLTLRYTTCCGCEESLMCTKMPETARPRLTDQKMTCIRTGVREDEASQSESHSPIDRKHPQRVKTMFALPAAHSVGIAMQCDLVPPVLCSSK